MDPALLAIELVYMEGIIASPDGGRGNATPANDIC